MQKELYHILKNENDKKLKWLVSSEDNMEEKVKSGTFHRDLYSTLATIKNLYTTTPRTQKRY